MKIPFFMLVFVAFSVMGNEYEVVSKNVTAFTFLPSERQAVVSVTEIVEDAEGELAEVVSEKKVVGFTHMISNEEVETLKLVKEEKVEAFLVYNITSVMAENAEGVSLSEPVEKIGLILPDVSERDDEAFIADDDAETDEN